MSWIKLDDGYPEHLKLAGASDAAFRADIEGMCLSSRAKGDGLVEQRVADRYWPKKVLDELVERGRWHRGHGCDTETCIRGSGQGFVVHDYLRYNPSAAKRDATSDARSSAASRRWRSANTDPPSIGVSSPLALGDGVGVRGSEVVKGKESPEFVEFYEHAYPRREGRGAARKAWAAAVQKANAERIIAGALRFREDPNRVDGYTPHPATWLNQERWDDDPLPPRGGGNGRPDRAALAMKRAQELSRERG